MEYAESATTAEREQRAGSCVFCRLSASGPPSAENGVVDRASGVFTVLNRYPYASGHLLVVPDRHVAELAELEPDEGVALWEALRAAVAGVERAYRPDGV